MIALFHRPQRSIAATLGLTMLKPGKNLFADFHAAKPQTQGSALRRLEELEKKVVNNFLEAAEALKEIKENKLYLQVADTWAQYCKERLGRGIEAVRLQIKALEISEKSHIVGEGPLIIRDLRKKTREPLASSHLDFEAAEFERRTHKDMDRTTFPAQPEDDLLDEIITRIRRARNNQGFLKALKEWLDESGM